MCASLTAGSVGRKFFAIDASPTRTVDDDDDSTAFL